MQNMALQVLSGQGTSLFVALGGVLDYYCGGVRVSLDVPNEDSWIEVEPDFNRDVLSIVQRWIRLIGHEFMDEYEAIEDRGGGVIRHYLAQSWFPENEIRIPNLREELISA